MSLRRLAVLGLVLMFAAGCPKKPAAEGAGSGASCYSAVQFFCEELPAPNAEQENALAVMCSSGSGAFKKPAACPPAGFLGKCTMTTGKDVKIRRFYPGAEAAYQQDFCVNTARGVWSTTF
jgi:hypothetical protein